MHDKNIILFPAYEVNVMWIHNTDVGRRSPRGNRVFCRQHVPSRHFRLMVTHFTITSQFGIFSM